MTIGQSTKRITTNPPDSLNYRPRPDIMLVGKHEEFRSGDLKPTVVDTVYVIDGDLTVHDTVRWGLEASNIRTVYFSTSDAFLRAYYPGSDPACIVLDVKLPGCTGPDLQERLLAQGVEVPIIFVSACNEIATAVRVMKRGAFDFVQKPFETGVLTRRVHEALAKDRERLHALEVRRRLEQRLRLLSDREREVMDLVVTGLSSRQIASRLFITRKTVECHRLRIMKKMAATNVAQLIYQLYSLGTLQLREVATVAFR